MLLAAVVVKLVSLLGFTHFHSHSLSRIITCDTLKDFDNNSKKNSNNISIRQIDVKGSPPRTSNRLACCLRSPSFFPHPLKTACLLCFYDFLSFIRSSSPHASCPTMLFVVTQHGR
jgi:hypothetical protein